ncbi:hypothetical protein ALI22I_37925 [Saccharothrix sp. ALI-22-I]|uniref:DUF4304 domain-containing protein n=1 Tax=Saccharothrix sp. ALI-22-I TaxID=1933778 RepID=UPI00097C81F6|nr:DUF4304 domain-containing protein [Saccharothrix sp. ALI-22-I]ONI81962.1 hypothetical protein ALI22I_37925 [Saccharothrix sp. ALI-22-I]
MASQVADNAYKVMLRDHLRPVLKAGGFRGSTTTWRRESERGDWAIVNLQRSRLAGRDGVWFTINLAVVARPWWEWINEYYRQRPALPSAASGYWRTRLDAPDDLSAGYRDWWAVHDTDSAHACGRDAAEQLARIGIPQVLSRLPRGAQLASARAGRFQGVPRLWDQRVPLAILLADDGPNPELDRLVAALEHEGGHEQLVARLANR